MQKNITPKNNKTDGLVLKVLELILYICIIHFGYYIAFKLELFSPLGYDQRNIEAYIKIMPYITISIIFILLFNNVFKMIKKSFIEIIATMSIVSIMINIITLSIAFFSREFALPRSLIVQAVFIHLGLLVTIKYIFVQILRKSRGIKEILIVAPIESKEIIVTKILSSSNNMDRVRYYVDPEKGDYDKLIYKVDKIFISDLLDTKVKDEIITKSITLNKSLYIVPKTFEIAIYNSDIIQFSDIPTFKVENLQLSLEKMVTKRIFDIIFSLMGIIVFSPLILITSLLILVTDGRPVFYTQERVTINNKKFRIIKFRSMVKDAEKTTGAVWASHNDDRVTPIGKLIRRFWLDELPQLFNVLKGDMSLVGPRPERPFFIDEFSKDIPNFNYRLTVKAGVTGLAQILGKYSTTPEYKIKYDLMYIRNASIYYDILIIVETIKKIIVGTLQRGENTEGSYEHLKIRYNLSEIEKNGIITYES